MPIMTFKEWLEATAHEGNIIETTGKGRGRLGRIDPTVEMWELVKDSADKDVKSAALLDMLKESTKWLRAKTTEPPNKSTALRVEAVKRLFGDVINELKALNPAVLGALDRFEAHKRNGKIGDVKLKGPYAHERTAYVENDKKRAPSATSLEDVYLDEKEKPSSSIPLLGGMFKREKFKKVENYSDLGLEEFRLLDEIAGKKKDVVYLKKMQRLKYLAYPVGGLLCDIDNVPLTIAATKILIYAMDRYGNLIVLNDRTFDSKGAMVNHSTLNAGNDVVCAGALNVENGLLKMINNSSGHYKPTGADLRRLLDVLRKEGLDLSQARAEVWAPAKNGGTDITSYQATQFLGGLAMPIGPVANMPPKK